jgi:hypothetical protein
MMAVMTLDQSPEAERAERLVRSACSSDVGPALALLAAEPALSRHDLACACVAGDAAEVTRRMECDPASAGALTGPLRHAPISYACFSRVARVDPDRADGVRAAVRVLLEAGADPDTRFTNDDGWVQSTLYGAAGIAGDAELTALLIDAGADPDDRDDEHTVGEALYHACEQRDPECARLLVEAGTPRAVVDYCLGRALNFPNLAMVRMLCAHGARPSAGQLTQAVWSRRGPETVAVLLGAGAPVSAWAVRTAAQWGDREVAELLGTDEAAVTDADRALGEYLSGRTRDAPPASLQTLGELLDSAVLRGDREAVRRLLEAGAAPDGAPGGDYPPLGVAAWHGWAGVVGELVDHGARTRWGDGGSAVGAALHGSRHCGDPEGGPTMITIEEIDRGRYTDTVRVLLAAGATVPESFGDAGGPSADTLLAELGVKG